MRHGRTVLWIALCVLGCCGPVYAQPAGPVTAEVEQAFAAIRPQAIRAHMGFLADDLLEGRRTGTRGYDLAAKYVAAQFEMLGLEPAGTGGGYLQPVPLVQITSDEPACSLAFLRDGRTTELRYGVDYFNGTQDAAVSAPVVFVGFGVTAPELGYDDYAGIDVRGKFVARLFGAPPFFPHDQRAFYSDPVVGVRNALAHGAARALGIAVIPDPFPEQVFFVRSDHYSFVQQGIPAIHLTGGFATGDPAVDGRAIWETWMQGTMHRPGDDMSQTIDVEAGARFAQLNLLISYLVAQADQAPHWNPGDFFGEKFRRRSPPTD